MTPTESRSRHMKFGRFGRNQSESAAEGRQGRRRGHWTGYRPLEDALTQARLAQLAETNEREMEERR